MQATRGILSGLWIMSGLSGLRAGFEQTASFLCCFPAVSQKCPSETRSFSIQGTFLKSKCVNPCMLNTHDPCFQQASDLEEGGPGAVAHIQAKNTL